MFARFRHCSVVLIGLIASVPTPAAERALLADRAAAVDFFEQKVRPLLVDNCYTCHSANTNSQGGLRVDDRNGLLEGGKSGPAVVPGRPDQSLLIRRVTHGNPKLRMPQDGQLSADMIADLRKWIQDGAAWPAIKLPASFGKPNPEYEKLKREHWAWQPLRMPPPPSIRQRAWARADIDRFILAKLEAAGLQPAEDAARTALIRRVTFDLIGLPPTPEQIDAFLRDDSPTAVHRVVDRLLASSAFGERWGRHWLDVARYGESTGPSRNIPYPQAWRYRDYVLDAFNADLPYDRFLCEQIAGDLLPATSPEERDRQVIATGFLALGVKDVNQRFKVRFVMDNIAEQIDTVTRSVLALAVSCARCHDHKFDPIPTTDYYALAGIFHSTDNCAGVRNKMGGGGLDYYDTTMLLEMSSGKGTSKSPVRAILGVREAKRASDIPLRIRGEAEKLGPVVARGFLSAVPVADSPGINPRASGRLELAQWLTSNKNPLTPRVIANRVWQHLFGRGLVTSVDNFGVTGDKPSHPELLDHLAVRFMRDGWSVKKLIRGIVLSHAYQLSADALAKNMAIDPANRLVWRHSPRRLDAEEIRDAMLLAAGTLDPARPVASPARDLKVVELLDNGPDARRLQEQAQASTLRSVYLPLLRGLAPHSLAVFDFAEQGLVTGSRDSTTVSPQALYLLNDPFVRRHSLALAERLLQGPDMNDAARIVRAYRLALGREPAAREIIRAQAYLTAYEAVLRDARTPYANATGALRPPLAAWMSFAQTLMCCAEFRYLQ
jgi:cytochrome c553